MARAALLVVEDSVFFAALIVATMREVAPHLRCIVVDDGYQALSILGSETGIVGVLLDITLTGLLSGIDVLAAMRRGPLRAMPAAIMSGTDRRVDMDRALSLGADYIPKPSMDLAPMETALQRWTSSLLEPHAAAAPRHPDPVGVARA